MILVERHAENYDSRGGTGNNIISYQHNKTGKKLYNVVTAVFNKRIKKQKVMRMAITMKVTITQ